MDLLLDRWFHILAGVTWVGLLYYFNFVQVPGLAKAKADGTAAGITKHNCSDSIAVVSMGCNRNLAYWSILFGALWYLCRRFCIARCACLSWNRCLAWHHYAV